MAMSTAPNPAIDPVTQLVYEIRIKGHLGPRWAEWFEGMSITLEENGETVLTGEVIDQAALHGVLKRIRDLGLPLLSIIPIQPEQIDETTVQ